MTRSHRYTTVAVALHWIIALMIVSLILVGWQMGDMENGAPGKEQLYQLHKSFGITVLTLTVARIAWRILNPPPPLPAGMKTWERTASHAVHLGFYGLMLAMPLTGWLYVSTAYEFDVSTVLFGLVSWPDIPGVGFLANETGHEAVEFVHSKLAWLAIGLIVLHVAGAVKHDLLDKEGVLNRMLPGWLGPTDGPVRPARGAPLAFGVAAVLFLAVAAIPVLAQGASVTLPSGGAAPDTAAADGAGDGSASGITGWQVTENREPIAFSGMHDGNPYSGEFANWTASIGFDPENLAASSAEVTVDLTSLTTNKKLYTDTLRTGEWLDLRDYPTATVSIDGFAPGETAGRYTAEAALRLKEGGQTVPLVADIAIEGETARVSGEAVFSRAALDLGMTSDPGADWVADEVTVRFGFTAARTGSN